MSCEFDNCEEGATSYAAASYVKFVESAGGRPFLVAPTTSDAVLTAAASCASGILFTGGDEGSEDWLRATRTLYTFSFENHVPLWGTCLGFERIVELAAGSDSAIQPNVTARNIMLPVLWDSNTLQNSVFGTSDTFRRHQKEIMAMSIQPLSLHFHQKGFKKQEVDLFENVKDNWLVLATGDYNGVEFVNMIEAKQAPIWGVQFHPEKIQFEWGEYLHGDKSVAAIEANRAFADFFIEQARKKRPLCAMDKKYIAFDYKLDFTGKDDKNPMRHFTTVYLV